MSGYTPAEINRLIGKDMANQRSIWKPFTADVLARMIGNVLGEATASEATRRTVAVLCSAIRFVLDAKCLCFGLCLTSPCRRRRHYGPALNHASVKLVPSSESIDVWAFSAPLLLTMSIRMTSAGLNEPIAPVFPPTVA